MFISPSLAAAAAAAATATMTTDTRGALEEENSRELTGCDKVPIDGIVALCFLEIHQVFVAPVRHGGSSRSDASSLVSSIAIRCDTRLTRQ